mmetsp:Transcript_17422/g.48377  ORF Transcript_17422/g.48377 Transcript_17422/m.48377 type:complete len:267 (-) Transcript_17422:928-1728(-)
MPSLAPLSAKMASLLLLLLLLLTMWALLLLAPPALPCPCTEEVRLLKLPLLPITNCPLPLALPPSTDTAPTLVVPDLSSCLDPLAPTLLAFSHHAPCQPSSQSWGRGSLPSAIARRPSSQPQLSRAPTTPLLTASSDLRAPPAASPPPLLLSRDMRAAASTLLLRLAPTRPTWLASWLLLWAVALVLVALVGDAFCGRLPKPPSPGTTSLSKAVASSQLLNNTSTSPLLMRFCMVLRWRSTTPGSPAVRATCTPWLRAREAMACKH